MTKSSNDAPMGSLRGAYATKQSHDYYVMSKQYFVYIMANKHNTVLYTGITNDLKKRVYEHREKLVTGFTKKYNISKLVYYEIYQDPESAIVREKQMKAGSRQKKIDLINTMNRQWLDLYDAI